MAMAAQGGTADPSRTCKRVTVVVCAIANLGVTLYVLHVLLATALEPPTSATSSLLVNYVRSWRPYGFQVKNLAKMQEIRTKEANYFRLRSQPVELIRRVNEIRLEVAMDATSNSKQAGQQDPSKPGERTEQEEFLEVGLSQQQVLDTGEQLGTPAVEDDELGMIERLLPPECHPETNTDFGGVAVRWGLTYHTLTAAECCKACLKQAGAAKPGQLKCNVWVFCPDEKGCVSPDAYEHRFGECWLKQADQPLASVKEYYLKRTTPSPPLPVLWVSGVTSA